MLLRGFFVFAILLNACKQSESSSNPPNGNGANSAGVSTANMVGTWTSGCITYSGNFNNNVKYKRTSVAISSTNFSVTTQEFADQSCTIPAGVNIASSSNYTLGQGIANIPGAKAFDSVPTSFTITVNDQVTADTYNSNQTCGRGNWVKGGTQDVLSCKDASGKPLVSPYFDIIQVTGNTLMNGKSDEAHDGSTAAKRPVILDTAEVYTKMSK